MTETTNPQPAPTTAERTGSSLDAIIATTRSHTFEYARDPEFRRYWYGFTSESRNLRAQQVRAFGELVGSVTETLKGLRVLDVGCGDGRWLRAFLEYDADPANVVGIDVSGERFGLGRAKNPLVNLVETDGVSIPFEDNSFDLVTQFLAFSCMPDVALRRHATAEIRRVLKPGGVLFWWDLLYTVAPSEPRTALHPAHYFDWPLRARETSEWPLPGECLRSLRGVRRLLAPMLNRLGHRPTHLAALVGPKPGKP